MNNNLKDYRENELRWFTVASVLFILCLSKSVDLAVGFEGKNSIDLIEFVSRGINTTIVTSATIVLVFIADSLLDVRIKKRIIYWRGKMPGESVFSRYSIQTHDIRFSPAMVRKKYSEVYTKLAETMEKRVYENNVWYSIYLKHSENAMIKTSNRDFLLCRDMASMTVIMFCAYLGLCVAKLMAFRWDVIVFLVSIYVITKIAANNKGNRLVANVIAVDMTTE